MSNKPLRQLCGTVLILEALVIGLAIPVAIVQEHLRHGVAGGVAHMLLDDGNRDGKSDNHGFHDQDGAAQLPEQLVAHDSSAAVKE